MKTSDQSRRRSNAYALARKLSFAAKDPASLECLAMGLKADKKSVKSACEDLYQVMISLMVFIGDGED